jgi:hypothetical protein
MARNVLLYSWLLSPLVFFFAYTYSDAPNQIFWGYTLTLFGLVASLVISRQVFASGIGELLALITMYFMAFYMVSFWEEFPGTTIEYGKFELIYIIVAINGFVIGRNLPQNKVVTLQSALAVILILITIAQMALDSDQIRYGYGLQLMLCLPAAMVLRQYLIVVIGLIIMLASFHKTSLVSALLSLTVITLLSKEHTLRPHVKFINASIIILSIVVGLTVAAFYLQEILYTVSRFLPEGSVALMDVKVDADGVDPAREYVTLSTLMLLPEYFIRGMGFMNFYIWSGAEVGEYDVNRFGQVIVGVNIHNSYMTWLLEGGLLVSGVVVVMLYRTIKKAFALYSYESSSLIGVVVLSWCVAVLASAAFHQLHSSIQLWGTIGMIFGYHAQFFHERPFAMNNAKTGIVLAPEALATNP